MNIHLQTKNIPLPFLKAKNLYFKTLEATPKLFKTNIFSFTKPALPLSVIDLRNHVFACASGLSSEMTSSVTPPLPAPPQAGGMCCPSTPPSVKVLIPLQCNDRFTSEALATDYKLNSKGTAVSYICIQYAKQSAGTQMAPNECLMKERQNFNSY